jgi:hypothetical protein
VRRRLVRDSSSARFELIVALGAVLQAVRAAGGEQVAEHGELVVLREVGGVGLDRERTLGGALGTAVAAAEVLGQRIAQGRLRGAVAACHAPLAGALRQAGERVDRLDRRDEHEAGSDSTSRNRFSEVSSRHAPQ